MQLFNQINARKLGNREFNVFKDFCNNWLFLFIVVLTFFVQEAMVQYGGRAMRCEPLTLEQNAICLAIGAFSLIWGVLIKILLPDTWFSRLAVREEVMTDQEEKNAFTTTLRKSFR